MITAKSHEKALKFREEGNKFLAQHEYYKALVAFNTSMCYSEFAMEISLGFERRSEVYLLLGQYKTCLRNIQAANDGKLPDGVPMQLMDREETCKKLMSEAEKPDPEYEPLNYFKLSYPPNEKIPFFVECLDFRENDKFGRHIVTSSELQPGDIIAIEDTFFNFINPNAVFTRCYNCLKANMLDLLPSGSSGKLLKLKNIKELKAGLKICGV